MTLSTKALNILAEKIAPEVAAAIFEDERWVDLLHEIVPDVVTRAIGDCDEDLLFDLSLITMERITLRAM